MRESDMMRELRTNARLGAALREALATVPDDGSLRIRPHMALVRLLDWRGNDAGVSDATRALAALLAAPTEEGR
jgi:hypothetical protein